MVEAQISRTGPDLQDNPTDDGFHHVAVTHCPSLSEEGKTNIMFFSSIYPHPLYCIITSNAFLKSCL